MSKPKSLRVTHTADGSSFDSYHVHSPVCQCRRQEANKSQVCSADSAHRNFLTALCTLSPQVWGLERDLLKASRQFYKSPFKNINVFSSCGWNESAPHSLGHMDTKSLVGGAVWKGLGCKTLLNDVCYWGCPEK